MDYTMGALDFDNFKIPEIKNEEDENIKLIDPKELSLLEKKY